MALLGNQKVLPTVDLHLFAEQSYPLVLAFPKITPECWSFVVEMKTIHHSHPAGLVIEKTI